MTRHPLDTAFAKLEHARGHAEVLGSAIHTFLAKEPYRLVPQLNEQHTEEVWCIAVDPIADQIECIAADAVHNIRTPLDKMLSADFPNKSIHAAGANIRCLSFPVSADQVNFENRLAKLKDHITAPVIEFLRAVEPYKSGKGRILWALNELDNRDKHHALLEPVKLGFVSANFGEIRTINGFMLRMGSKRGKNMIPVPDARPGAWHMHQTVENLRPITKTHPLLPNKICLEFTSPYDDMEVFTTTPRTQLSVDIIPNLDLAFGNLPGFEGTPAVKVVERMWSGVHYLLEEYKRTFF